MTTIVTDGYFLAADSQGTIKKEHAGEHCPNCGSPDNRAVLVDKILKGADGMSAYGMPIRYVTGCGNFGSINEFFDLLKKYPLENLVPILGDVGSYFTGGSTKNGRSASAVWVVTDTEIISLDTGSLHRGVRRRTLADMRANNTLLGDGSGLPYLQSINMMSKSLDKDRAGLECDKVGINIVVQAALAGRVDPATGGPITYVELGLTPPDEPRDIDFLGAVKKLDIKPDVYAYLRVWKEHRDALALEKKEPQSEGSVDGKPEEKPAGDGKCPNCG